MINIWPWENKKMPKALGNSTEALYQESCKLATVYNLPASASYCTLVCVGMIQGSWFGAELECAPIRVRRRWWWSLWRSALLDSVETILLHWRQMSSCSFRANQNGNVRPRAVRLMNKFQVNQKTSWKYPTLNEGLSRIRVIVYR